MTGNRAPPPLVPLIPAKLGRLLLCLIYETLLLAAVIMAATLPVVMLTTAWQPYTSRATLQAVLLATCGAYFVSQWTRTGQTLAMKTWRLKLMTQSGEPLTPMRATARYLLALAGTLACGAGFLWVVADRERKFLHDRLAGTRIVDSD